MTHIISTVKEKTVTNKKTNTKEFVTVANRTIGASRSLNKAIRFAMNQPFDTIIS